MSISLAWVRFLELIHSWANTNEFLNITGMVWTHSELRRCRYFRKHWLNLWWSDQNLYLSQEPSFVYLCLFQVPTDYRGAFIWLHPETSASCIHAFVQQMHVEHLLCASHSVKFRKTGRNVLDCWWQGAAVETYMWGSKGMERRRAVLTLLE